MMMRVMTVSVMKITNYDRQDDVGHVIITNKNAIITYRSES